MIYLKRTLWLLGYPIIWLLSCILFMISLFVMGFECMFLYIKNGDIQDCAGCLEWCIKIVVWYNDIEPKENELKENEL